MSEHPDGRILSFCLSVSQPGCDAGCRGALAAGWQPDGHHLRISSVPARRAAGGSAAELQNELRSPYLSPLCSAASPGTLTAAAACASSQLARAAAGATTHQAAGATTPQAAPLLLPPPNGRRLTQTILTQIVLTRTVLTRTLVPAAAAPSSMILTTGVQTSCPSPVSEMGC